MTTELYDMWDHSTQMLITESDTLEGIARCVALDPFDITACIEEYGRCDTAKEGEYRGDPGLVIVPAGDPYPGSLTP